MDFKKDDFVRLVSPTGDYRYGFVEKTAEGAMHLAVCMHDEGDSRLAFEEAAANFRGFPPATPSTRLTPAEEKIARHLALGETNKGIADDLGISAQTVRTHIRNLMLRFGFQDRVQLRTHCTTLVHRLDAQKGTA